MKEYICVREISGGIYIHDEFTPVRELVRCKDCVLRFTNECALQNQAFPVNKGNDWFCADGRRQ